MKTALRLALVLFLIAACGPAGLQAQSLETGNASGPATDIDPAKTPWLEGVTISPVPAVPSPKVELELVAADGNPLPATLSEDVAITCTVHSPVFDAKPPADFEGQALTNGEWAGQCSVNWFFDDVGKNKSTQASCSEPLPLNQMKVTPLDPTGHGAVTVFVSRPMRYEYEPGKLRRIYVTGGKSHQAKVTDITPPCCGIELTVGKHSATVWSVEEPPHKYPLPKTADVMGKGALLSHPPADKEAQLSGIELGTNAVLPAEQLTIHLPKKGELKIQLAVTDNDQVDEKSLRFGFCEVMGDQIKVLGEESPAKLDLAKAGLPAKAWVFVEAKDMTGNLSRLVIPIQLH